MVNSLEELVDVCIDLIIDFYKACGIQFGERPTYLLLNEYNPHLKGIIAQVPSEQEEMAAVYYSLMKKLFLAHVSSEYKRLNLSFSLEVSEESFDIDFERMRAEQQSVVNEFDSVVDLVFYRSLIDIIGPAGPALGSCFVANLLAHELWHVVEKRNGVLASPIREGTAEAVRLIFEARITRPMLAETGQSGSITPPDFSEPVAGKNVMVKYAADLVYKLPLEIVMRNARSIKDILDPEKRKRMEAEYHRCLDAFYKERVEKNEMPYEERAAVSRMKYPEYDILDAGLTKQNLVLAMRLVGLHRMVDELSQQDCTSLLAEYQKMGYGPK